MHVYRTGGRVKRFLIVLMSLGMLAGSWGTAEAGKSKRVERTVEGSYGLYPSPVTGCNEVLGPWACMNVRTRSTEAFFTAKVTDSHGQPVFVEVLQSSGGRIVFCGQTKAPIAIRPGAELSFHVGLASWPRVEQLPQCPTNHVKTTGTIRVTLSNQR